VRALAIAAVLLIGGPAAAEDGQLLATAPSFGALREADGVAGESERSPFLPMPVSRPMTVPQQEAPGIVVSTVSGEEGTPMAVTAADPARPLGTTDTGEPLKLAHYAFGAYQRGLYNTAFSVAMRAAAQDDADAAALIGRLYEEAKGREQDLDKAAGWYAIAADLGHAGAQNRLALMLLTGRGLPKDAERAADVFEAAAKAGSADAAHSFALMLLKGEGRERDLEKAFRYMLEAAKGGAPAAQYAAAVMYEEGQGTLPDEREATRWFGRAARSGHRAAVLPYAMRLFDGIGTDPDEARAAQYFAAAARDGDPVAMNRYARILANGRGAKADATEAIKWHLLARQAGISDLFLDGFMGTADPEVVEEARRRVSDLSGG
jgi:hypothetical protein